VIVGEEVRSQSGDLIGLYLEEPVASGLSAAETARRIHDQGGLVGLPHPFDRFRASSGRHAPDDELDALLGLVDYIEVFNARLIGRGNQRAADLAASSYIPAAAVSDAHTVFEVGVSYTYADGPIDTPADLLRALAKGTLVMSRGSYYARAFTPLAKLIQRSRGNTRQLATSAGSR
jgi:predicted metal-dependent phosphoesterase TrpH